MEQPQGQELFDALAEAHVGQPGVTFGQVWHHDGLKVHNKIFAMYVRGELVVKVPAARASELVGAGLASVYEPGPGRKMREWVSIPVPDDPSKPQFWIDAMEEARQYVAALATAPR